MLKEKVVEVYGVESGQGMQVFDSNKAPLGGHLLDAFNNTVWVRNGDILVIVDPVALTAEENPKRFFKTETVNGKNTITYCRVWKFNPTTGSGDDLVIGKEAWIEYRGHIRDYTGELPSPEQPKPEEPKPEVPVVKPIDGDFEISGIRFSGGKLVVHLKQVE